MNSEEKRVINGETDVNQLVPFKHTWAWDKYLAGCANHWMPQEVSMTKDIELWKSNQLSNQERLMIKRNLGFFVTADSLAANNIVLGTYRHITSPECYAEGTEVLASNGEWIDLRNVKVNDCIAQYNKNGTVEFIAVEDVFSFKTNNKMYSFKNGLNSYDLLVTDNHRMVTRDIKTKEIKINYAGNLKGSVVNEFPVSGVKLNGTKTSLSSHEKFLIALQADGSLRADRKNEGIRSGTKIVQFNFRKGRKILRLIEIINECGFNYSITEPKRSLDKTAIYVHVPIEINLQKTFCWVDLIDVTYKWALEFIEEVQKWDGRINSDNVGYVSTIKENTDKLQAIAAIAGVRCNVTKYVDDRSDKFNDTYNVSITKTSDSVSGQCIIREEIKNYNGKVYCVTVPSGMVIVRYKGCVAISGNCRQFLLRQAFEEAIHTHAYQYIVQSLGLDEGEIFNSYNTIPSIKEKDDFLIPFIDILSNPHFKTGTTNSDKQFFESVFVFCCIMEGLFFYVGFAQILSMKRQNKMIGAGEQYEYILRDESSHCAFGIDLLNTIKKEQSEIWTIDLQDKLIELMDIGVYLESKYAYDTMPTGFLGMNAGLYVEYIKFVAHRRLCQIGLEHKSKYSKAENPFPWMSEIIDLKKEKNFFETRVIEYQTGGALTWDDEMLCDLNDKK